eukprot:CAMPEP_0174272530 /NCGR_PEP_ID=MMETSP0439-20130205/51612_1 /TAXON_ID=0 /ORGANISM="Stereomyxa ramosa, Strain Chinc5" /LENGTH=54 /DNA_ID=CAMNT_0015363165 /DNA_START=66 /DNA_END=227 /DNA_ORIENTATION=+
MEVFELRESVRKVNVGVARAQHKSPQVEMPDAFGQELQWDVNDDGEVEVLEGLW